MKPTLYLVIPCYNEEDVLPLTAPIFADKLRSLIKGEIISKKSRVMFVNDGSSDKTRDIINDLSRGDDIYCGITLSRNRGHQNALLAGLMEARNRCDITISIDCDGQDDINAVDDMVREYLGGCDIVYGVRKDRKSDRVFKRTSAQGFYKFLHFMGADVVYNHADYRLISAKALDALSEFKEVNLFLRGMVPLVGFKSACVFYKRSERLAGKSHYPLRKMLSLAADGITSLSVKPLKMITFLGTVVSILSFIGVLFALISWLCHNTVSGWASTTCIICFVSGIQLISIGIIGEYLGKIYLEVKARPRYIISEKTKNIDEK